MQDMSPVGESLDVIRPSTMTTSLLQIADAL